MLSVLRKPEKAPKHEILRGKFENLKKNPPEKTGENLKLMM